MAVKVICIFLIGISVCQAQMRLWPYWVGNTDANAQTTTVIGCDHVRNSVTHQGRSGATKVTCQTLLNYARSVALDQSVCCATAFFSGSEANPFVCKNSGDIEYVNTTYVGRRKRGLDWTQYRKCVNSATYQPLSGTGNCGSSIMSIYTEEIIGKYRVIATNGLPDHDYTQKTPNTPCETYKIMIIPLQRIKATTSWVGSMGPLGIARSGAYIFNHMSAEPVCRTAYTGESMSFGPCQGHAQMAGNWHYHGPSTCLKQSGQFLESTTRDDALVGYMVDGSPVRSNTTSRRSCYKLKDNPSFKACTAVNRGRYVPVWQGCDPADWTHDTTYTNCELDDSSGYLENNAGQEQYTYYLTDTYPYANRKLAGEAYFMCTMGV